MDYNRPNELKKAFDEKLMKSQIWGQCVKEIISDEIKNTDSSLKPTFFSERQKKYSSFYEKITRKGYKALISDVEDYFGMRYIFLLDSEVFKFAQLVNACDRFDVTTSKNYFDDMDQMPDVFDYQSMHLIVRPIENFELDGIEIDSTICCEIQVRNLLQHAYAELSHNNIYKNEDGIECKVKRKLSRSMALIESTSDIFSTTKNIIDESTRKSTEILDFIEEKYFKIVGIKDYNTKLNLTYYRSLKSILPDDLTTQLLLFYNDTKNAELKVILDKCMQKEICDLPVLCLLHYLITEKNYAIEQVWIFDKEPLIIIRGILCISDPNS